MLLVVLGLSLCATAPALAAHDDACAAPIVVCDCLWDDEHLGQVVDPLTLIPAPVTSPSPIIVDEAFSARLLTASILQPPRLRR